MTGAIKNLFGTIPGTEKFEMHARFPDIQDFCSMILDLASLHTKRTRVISLTDGIVGMEGNGPTNGKARKIGILAASENPFALDAVCADLLGLTDKVLMLRLAKERKLYEQEKLCVIGSSVESCRISDFCLPDSRSHASLLSNRKLMHYFEPRPAINVEKCVGCGECARSCPKHTIRMINGKDGRRQARIDHSACIKCFCCQELCPHDAVKIKQNFLLKFLK
jgi:ferredoxin